MNKRVEKFLEFNGKVLPFLSVDGTWYIAVKPICEVLGVEHTRIFKNLKDDEILAGAWAKQPMHDTSGRLQEMVCLPERFVYGWLFGIRSESENLKLYKLECYNALYNHFHGTLTLRVETLDVRASTENEIRRVTSILAENADYQELLRLRNIKSGMNKTLGKLDDKLMEKQTGLFGIDADE